MATVAPDPRFSDAATGLPPLEEVEEEGAIVVVQWVGSHGLVKSPINAEPIPVRFLSIRGLVLPTDEERAGGATAVWAQFHVAVPVEHSMDVASALATGGMFDDDSK